MDLSGALQEEIILQVYDEEWVQAVDYDHVPFRCRKCHEHGNLYRDCPLNKLESNKKKTTRKIPRVSLRWGVRGKEESGTKRKSMRMDH